MTWWRSWEHMSGNLHTHWTPLLFSNLTYDRHVSRKLSLHKIVNHAKHDWKTKEHKHNRKYLGKQVSKSTHGKAYACHTLRNLMVHHLSDFYEFFSRIGCVKFLEHDLSSTWSLAIIMVPVQITSSLKWKAACEHKLLSRSDDTLVTNSTRMIVSLGSYKV